MVTPSYYPIKGGAETLIRNLSIKLNQVGIHTDLMTFNMDQKWKPRWQSRTEEIDGFTVYKIPALNWFPLQHSDRITLGINLIPGRFRHLLERYDIIHFHVGDFSFPVFSLTTTKPKIAHFHGPLGFHRRYFLSRLMLRNIADSYIAISRSMHQDLIDLGVQPDRISYLPNAVDTTVFRPDGNRTENLLLFVGRITYGKGVHILLKSLVSLRTKTQVVIIGPPDWDTGYFKVIQSQINHENRRGVHKITYLGMQDQDSIAKWCQKASVFVLPSFKEACGLAIIEALSCGTPVVATDIDGIREVVTEGKDGILVPTNNSLQLASAIQYLLDNETVRTNFGRQARLAVQASFSFDSAIANLVRIYKELS
jgi:glycosyltransferase involved in cell wall biosynthesis